VEPAFIDNLRLRLHQHGVPRRYVRRVVGELSEHFEMLVAEYVDRGTRDDEAVRIAEQQLAADPEALIDALVRGRSRGITGVARRHPVVTFVLSPLPVAVVLAYFCKFAGIFLYTLVCRGFHVDYMNPTFVAIVKYTFTGGVYGLTPALALAYCCLAERSRRGIVLALASSALLSLAGGVLLLDLVQCTASRHVAYFQRYGWDGLRMSLPLIVFTAHAARRLLLVHRPYRPATGR